MTLQDLLAGNSARSFKFDHPGMIVTGTVTAVDVVQRRNFDTNEPETWADGKPVQQIRVELATDLRDPSDHDDDGTRCVWIKTWGDQLRGLRDAARAAGVSDITPGCQFSMTYTGDGEVPAGKRGNPPKLYVFRIAAASPTRDLLSGPPANASAVVAPAEPVSNPSVAVIFTPAQLAAMKAAGLDTSRLSDEPPF